MKMSLLSPQLQAFIAVCQQKTVHGASEKLFITQTAVTQRIKNLEKSCNTTLFIRSRKGMSLTVEGEALLRYCHAVIELEGETLAQLQDGGKIIERTITLCAPSSIMQSRILPSCLPIMKQYKNLLFYFDVNDLEKRHLLLKQGDCDFAIINEEQLTPEMKFKKLKPEEYILVCTSQWHQRNLIDILSNERIIDFEPNDPVTSLYLHKYQLTKYCKQGRYFINNTQKLAMLIEQGIGYSVLTKEFAKPLLDNGKLISLNHSEPFNVTPVLAWYHRPEPANYFSDIIEVIA